MKKFTTLLLAILMVLPAMAWSLKEGDDLYFVKPEEWTYSYCVFMIGNDNGSDAHTMTKIENTNLYYKSMPAWNDYGQWAVFNTDATWSGWEGNKISNRKTWAKNSTNIVSAELKTHNLLKDGSSEQINDFSSLNHTQAVTVEGGEGTISMSSYNLTAANTAAATNGTTSVSAVYTANVECTATAADGYRFVGWYNGETLLSDKPTYTYVAENADKAIVAKFEEVTAETPVLSNFTASATEVMVGETITFTCAVENGEVAKIVYKINNEAIVGNTWTPEACGVYTATATYEGATPVELASTITVKEKVVFNVTVPEGTPACYIAGDMNDWSFTAMTKEEETHYTWSFITTTMDFAYKYTCGQDWVYVEKGANGEEISDRTYSANDVVAKWNKYPENITAGMYYLVPGEWEDENVALYAAEFINKNTETSKFEQGYLNDHFVYFQLKEGEYTHVKFYQVENPDKSTTTTVIEDFATMTKLAETPELTYTAPGAGNIMRYNVDESKWEEVEIGTGVNRVELAGGIGYAYGVVSAEGAIEVYNVNGAVVARGNDNVDLRGLGRGVYIIRNGNQVRKVVR